MKNAVIYVHGKGGNTGEANRYKQFFDDSFEMQDCEDGKLIIVRESNGYTARLEADFTTKEFVVTATSPDGETKKPEF